MRALIAIALAVIFTTPAVFAKTSKENRALARQQAKLGQEAVAAKNWAAARDAYARAYRLDPNANYLRAFADALHKNGNLVQAAERYRLLLEEKRLRGRAQIEKLVEDITRRIPRLTIRAPALLEGDVLYLDARPIPKESLGQSRLVDPGEHIIQVQRKGQNILRKEFVLIEAESRPLEIAVPPPAVEEKAMTSAPAVVTTPAESKEEGGSSNILLWTGVGVGAAAVIVVGILLLGGGTAETYAGTTGVRVEALGGPEWLR